MRARGDAAGRAQQGDLLVQHPLERARHRVLDRLAGEAAVEGEPVGRVPHHTGGTRLLHDRQQRRQGAAQYGRQLGVLHLGAQDGRHAQELPALPRVLGERRAHPGEHPLRQPGADEFGLGTVGADGALLPHPEQQVDEQPGVAAGPLHQPGHRRTRRQPQDVRRQLPGGGQRERLQ
ncbi:hypothetical protein [Streptomyces sudanensis]|uniref:hypothetical protein n=1 Tax=Streptomyces sudanensis TaxID=436397 RepID=UPI0020CEAB04|nr:hypothetical protein [Streptomyces sudanensis]MCP9957579.1 hypothetical protein [Streptomyces sudanensis]